MPTTSPKKIIRFKKSMSKNGFFMWATLKNPKEVFFTKKDLLNHYGMKTAMAVGVTTTKNKKGTSYRSIIWESIE